MAERIGCAHLSEEVGEGLAGTASHVHRWLLVEQPGPWGADAPHQSRLPAEVAVALSRRARQARTRLLLIRRAGREREMGPRSAFVAVTRMRTRWIERVRFEDPGELLDLDWDGLATDTTVGGHRSEDPLFLVCTNGAHDACCAQRGRPLAAAIAHVEPEATWECTHFGGDRFAANLVCLPSGAYYGRVDPTTGPTIAAAERSGTLHLANLRGRSAMPFPVQAADIALRRAHGLTALDALRLDRHERLTADRRALRFRRADGTPYEVRVETRLAGPPRVLSCGALPQVAPTFVVTDLAGRRLDAS